MNSTKMSLRDQQPERYALRDLNKPIGVSEFRLTEALPEKLKGQLPTIEELESELNLVDTSAQQSET